MRKNFQTLKYHRKRLSELDIQRDQYHKEQNIAIYSQTKRCVKERKTFRDKINILELNVKIYIKIIANGRIK